MSAICAGPNCSRPAVALGLCDSHRKQRQRGEPLTPLRRRTVTATLDAADVLVQAAAIAFADSPRDLADQAYAELLRAVENRERVLGQGALSQAAVEDAPHGTEHDGTCDG